MRVFRLTCFASWLAATANAFWTGAGSCNPGTTAILTPGLPHATNAQVGGTSLSSFGLEVSLNGTRLVPDTPTDFNITEPYEISIKATEDDFRGFLIRMQTQDNGIDTTTALAPTGDDNFVRVALETCVIINLVGGLTHNNPTRTTVSQVSGILQLDEPAEGLIMDITVVVRNSVAQNISQWYFSSFTLNAVDPFATAPPVAGPPTDAPVDSQLSAAFSFSNKVMSATTVVGLLGAAAAYWM